MIKLIFKIIIFFSSISLLPIVYFVKSSSLFDSDFFRVLFCFLIKLNFDSEYVLIVAKVIFSLIIFLLFFMANGIGIFLKDFLRNDTISKVKAVEDISDSYVAPYLSYIFVALSIPDGKIEVLFFIYIVICILLFSHGKMYFNLFFVLLGYSYYKVETSNCAIVYIITKKNITESENVNFKNLAMLTRKTFLDKEL